MQSKMGYVLLMFAVMIGSRACTAEGSELTEQCAGKSKKQCKWLKKTGKCFFDKHSKACSDPEPCEDLSKKKCKKAGRRFGRCEYDNTSKLCTSVSATEKVMQEAFTATIHSAEAQEVHVQAAGFLKTSTGKWLHKIHHGSTVEFSLTNNLPDAQVVWTYQTPLDEHEMSTDFLGSCPDLDYVGMITDGSHYLGSDTALIGPGETITRILDLADLGMTSKMDGSIDLNLRFHLHYQNQRPARGDENTHLSTATMNTNTVSLGVTAVGFKVFNVTGLGETEDSAHAGRNGDRGLGTAIDTSTGVPGYTFECKDDTTPGVPAAGYTCSPRACTCASLSGQCHKGSVNAACPATCGTCRANKDKWYSPIKDRTVGHDGCTKEQKHIIAEAEDLKQTICRDVLFHLKNFNGNFQSYNNDVVMSIFKRWTGRISSGDLEMFYKGFTKICSVDNYEYKCDPSNCPITTRYKCDTCSHETLYTDYQQGALIEHAKFDKAGWTRNCHSATGCTTSGTVAWVIKQDVGLRTINLCPLMFWIGATERQTNNNRLNTQAATIIHELSHFIDTTDNSDLEYNIMLMQEAATNKPGSMNNNAATWDNFAGDSDWPNVKWACFLDPEGCGETKPKAPKPKAPAPKPKPSTGPTTKEKCDCRMSWKLTGYETCTVGCCNPDNDSKGKWCFTVDPTCASGQNWGYC